MGLERGAAAYAAVNGQKDFQPIGFIPQVPHTYAYFEETYAAVNEHQLAIGEATCSSIFSALSVDLGGKALFSIDELSRIALERTTNAREAIKLMGSLAEQYGFYGPGFEGTGESLVVADTVEGWVFHILPDDTGSSAIWAAQRIPDNHFTVIANMFIIRDVNSTDTANFMHSANMYPIALKHKFIRDGEVLDFAKVYSTGEYSHIAYSGRRMWRAFTLAAPSQASRLPANYTNLRTEKPYPFSLKPDRLMTLGNLRDIYRDYLKGTQFDLTTGLAAGPFGTPDRYTGGKGESQVRGSWERPIGLFRTSNSYIVQLRDWMSCKVGAICWYGPHAAHGTVFAPFAVGMTELPDAYSYGVQAYFNRSSAFWAHRYVLNLANLKFEYAIKDVQAAQAEWEKKGELLRDDIDAKWKAGSMTVAEMTNLYVQHAKDLVAAWWNLADALMFKYADGFVSEPGKIGQSVGYPAWWLKAVGYPGGPPKPPHMGSSDADNYDADAVLAAQIADRAVAPIPPRLRGRL